MADDNLTDEKKLDIDLAGQLDISSVPGREACLTNDTMSDYLTDIIRDTLERNGCRVSGTHYVTFKMTITAEILCPR